MKNIKGKAILNDLLKKAPQSVLAFGDLSSKATSHKSVGGTLGKGLTRALTKGEISPAATSHRAKGVGR